MSEHVTATRYWHGLDYAGCGLCAPCDAVRVYESLPLGTECQVCGAALSVVRFWTQDGQPSDVVRGTPYWRRTSGLEQLEAACRRRE